jgi:hypothetical protein
MRNVSGGAVKACFARPCGPRPGANTKTYREPSLHAGYGGSPDYVIGSNLTGAINKVPDISAAAMPTI